MLSRNFMPPVQKRTFSLPARQARFIDNKVRAGTYASASEVVRAGLRALEERDAIVEGWLRSEVGPVYDAMKADPKRAISAKKAFAAVRARHAEKVKAAKRGA
jgi:antitoxin ParD1/3/4